MNVYELRDQFAIDALAHAPRPSPTPGPGQVLVRVRAVSLNYRDLLVVKGLYSRNLKLPLVPCSDAAGDVLAVGPGVKRVKAGDRVAGIFMQGWLSGPVTETAAKTALGGAIDGVLAEEVLLSEEGLVVIPDHLSYVEASTLPCAAVTAWNALMVAGQIKPGDTVLTLGTGGVSIFALQFAKLAGAQVIATSSSDAKLARARQLGADKVVNYKTNPDWEQAVRQLTNGRGVDVVVEVGGAGTLDKSVKSVRMAGTIALIGVLSGGNFNPASLLMKSVHLQGIFVGSRDMFVDMNRAITHHQLRPIVDKVFPFAQAHDALRHLESGSHFGKVVIEVAP